MIPWSTFNSSELRPDWRIDLNEHNLSYFSDKEGHSPLEEKMNVSMLELAHERQFVMAQLGTLSVGFEAEHKARIQYTFQRTKDYFTSHYLEEPSCRPSVPRAQEVSDLDLPSTTFEPLPSRLEMSDLDEPEPEPEPEPELDPAPRTPSLQAPTLKSSSPFLTLHQLMNPEPPSPRSSKRKISPAACPGVLSGDFSRSKQDYYVDSDGVRVPLAYARANELPPLHRASRTRRDVRMRPVKSKLGKSTRDVQQSEDQGQLVSNDPERSHYEKKGS
ncbi:hypothetical protein A1O1_01311 [Capronia coronata CBS 617.96]|uniref:Uncharacterized protein n=1 Tax=Capronia coronata CBS 617.96 TaxID=1182541 RepID=W9Z2J5_9EURO|nr:uncharacterized protein A1O1_01311 [Capronia coronata CBS 617.96]EXJ96185.1 hypothetical protein A1O1_01311 [Capronia coronata CBS 617.96]